MVSTPLNDHPIRYPSNPPLIYRHPDKNPHPDAETKFIEVNKAYEVRLIVKISNHF